MDAEDRISGLPHDVVLSILYRLTAKEAARTCILSQQWRNLWNFNPTLSFDGSKTLYYHDKERKNTLSFERRRYVNWVNCVLKSYQGPVIEEFKVVFDLDRRHWRQIDAWIRFALDKKVKKLELDLSTYHGSDQRSPYRLYRQAIGFEGCTSLTTLVLRRINVGGGVLHYVISNCRFLERLCIVSSNFPVDLKVASSATFLKYLEITNCFDIKSLEISAPNLVSFTCSGPKYWPRISFPFEKFPNLVELSIGGTHCDYLIYNIRHFSTYVTRLNKLVLDVGLISEDIDFHNWPVLSHLRQLELSVVGIDFEHDLLVFSPLIAASPNLCRLALETMWGYPIRRRQEQTRVPETPHHCLKVVEWVGFEGNIAACTEFVSYLVKNAVMLEKIVVDLRYKNEEARNSAAQLGKRYSLGDKLVVL